MKINGNSEEYELEFYLQIIDYFQKERINREEIEIWKNKSIIELMKYLKRTQNRTLVTNALILIISLSGDIPPDTYNNRGININRISEKDKRFLIEDLKEEFLPN
jgi:hypothetical protein